MRVADFRPGWRTDFLLHYESVGFQRFDSEWGLQRNPPEDHAARRSARLERDAGEAAA
jgi:hypothetical protein